jgi:hypothetical protein
VPPPTNPEEAVTSLASSTPDHARDIGIPRVAQHTGPDGATALAAQRGGPIPATYTVTTPSGGRHLY